MNEPTIHPAKVTVPNLKLAPTPVLCDGSVRPGSLTPGSTSIIAILIGL
jgi:hypothetical protein